MKDVIVYIGFVIAISVCCYNLGKTQASLNVHSYDNISSSVTLACTAMIDKRPTDEVQHNIDAYFMIRTVLGEK